MSPNTKWDVSALSCSFLCHDMCESVMFQRGWIEDDFAFLFLVAVPKNTRLCAYFVNVCMYARSAMGIDMKK